jgi:hypothetical protein
LRDAAGLKNQAKIDPIKTYGTFILQCTVVQNTKQMCHMKASFTNVPLKSGILKNYFTPSGTKKIVALVF